MEAVFDQGHSGREDTATNAVGILAHQHQDKNSRLWGAPRCADEKKGGDWSERRGSEGMLGNMQTVGKTLARTNSRERNHKRPGKSDVKPKNKKKSERIRGMGKKDRKKCGQGNSGR